MRFQLSPVSIFLVTSALLTACGGGGSSSPKPPDTALTAEQLYQNNLKKIRASTVRNTNLDNSPYRQVPMADIPIDALLGPREDYIRGDDGVVPGQPGGNPEPGFPTQGLAHFASHANSHTLLMTIRWCIPTSPAHPICICFGATPM
jgi:hypothetical protein